MSKFLRLLAVMTLALWASFTTPAQAQGDFPDTPGVYPHIWPDITVVVLPASRTPDRFALATLLSNSALPRTAVAELFGSAMSMSSQFFPAAAPQRLSSGEAVCLVTPGLNTATLVPYAAYASVRANELPTDVHAEDVALFLRIHELFHCGDPSIRPPPPQPRPVDWLHISEARADTGAALRIQQLLPEARARKVIAYISWLRFRGATVRQQWYHYTSPVLDQVPQPPADANLNQLLDMAANLVDNLLPPLHALTK